MGQVPNTVGDNAAGRIHLTPQNMPYPPMIAKAIRRHADWCGVTSDSLPLTTLTLCAEIFFFFFFFF